MGRQIRFYMLPEDERVFLQFVRRDPSLVLLTRTSPTPELRIIENSLVSPPQDSELISILFWNTTLPIDESDIREIHLKRYDAERGVYVETGKVLYSIDLSNAPVIELSRSFIRTDGQLVKGRIWAEMYQLEGDTWVHKGAGFESSYDRIARWLRRSFGRVKGADAYFGRKALEWYQEGGRLSK
jgi:hypothetical protein